MDPPVRMGVVVTSILHESIHGLLYFYLSHFILQSVKNKKSVTLEAAVAFRANPRFFL